ncbi:hypothetical protein QBC42DRAFT_273175 [Cladorrhinum samala]|uniref:Cytidyltransferase-like domain-containing protein n=1 Tax=Cladorrhinum samala TaxID=585594 RepID=A0AAV9HJ44_9PEZI|nr:hypothetical protein QBC42DRAFT_273175 [Cladorrhinum samala]
MKRDDLPSLLLLPFPPDPSSRPLLNAAYRPPITAALSKLKNPNGASKLTVAVACPVLQGPYLRSKTLSWPQAEALIAGIYAIISIVSAELQINTEIDGGPNSVDATVVLIDHGRDKRFTSDFRPAIEPNNTIILDLATFATAYHPWKHIFHVRSEAGLGLYQTYLRFAEGRQTLLQDQLVPVEGGLTMNEQPSSPPQTSTYPTICLGGTFDYLHPGHKLLLTAGAFLLNLPRKDEGKPPARYIIGITGDSLLKNKKHAEFVQAWSVRARNVIVFLSRLLQLSERGWKDGLDPQIEELGEGDLRASFRNGTIQVQCVRIEDPFGPTITVQDIDALVVSGETREGGKAVNDKRVEQGWKVLEVFEVDVLDADEIREDEKEEVKRGFETKISSSEIRERRALAGGRGLGTKI